MNVVPAQRGWAWLALGWRLFKRNAFAWLVTVLAYWLTIALINEIPVVGAIASAILIPVFTASFMNACADAEKGLAPSLRSIASGFRNNLPTQLTVGLLYLLSMLIALGVATFWDDGLLFRWMVRGTPPPQEAIVDGTALRGLLAALLAAVPGFLAFWFAPILVAWQGMGAIKSMFFSFFASLRNWRAFALYGVAIAMFALMLSIVVAILAGLTKGNANAVRVIMLCLTIGILPTIFASFYYSYRDIFGDRDEKVDAEIPETQESAPKLLDNPPN